LFAAGCGSDSANTTQQLRVVMASADTPPVDILIDGTQVATSLGFRNATGYIPLKTGQRRVQAVAVSNSASIFQQNVSLAGSANMTLIVAGPRSSIQALVLTDGKAASTTTSTTTIGNVRVLNASSSMGAADAYIVNAGAGLNGATPVVSGLAFGKDTGYQSEPVGNYEVFLTAPGTNSVFLSTGALALTQNQFQTVVAVDGDTGGFNYIALTDQ
jgi:hypothetical protein